MRQVRVIADRNATLDAHAQWPMFDQTVVGTFDDSFSLWRVFDEAELRRIAATGRITGGPYAAKPERAFGASWGYNIDAIIRGGLAPAARRRLGPDLYVARIDALDRRFLHLGPGFVIDPDGPAEQPFEMDAGRCNWGLGCSLTVDLGDADLDLYALGSDEQLRLLSADDLGAFA